MWYSHEPDILGLINKGYEHSSEALKIVSHLETAEEKKQRSTVCGI
jgi:hypothetical protein